MWLKRDAYSFPLPKGAAPILNPVHAQLIEVIGRLRDVQTMLIEQKIELPYPLASEVTRLIDAKEALCQLSEWETFSKAVAFAHVACTEGNALTWAVAENAERMLHQFGFARFADEATAAEIAAFWKANPDPRHPTEETKS